MLGVSLCFIDDNIKWFTMFSPIRSASCHVCSQTVQRWYRAGTVQHRSEQRIAGLLAHDHMVPPSGGRPQGDSTACAAASDTLAAVFSPVPPSHIRGEETEHIQTSSHHQKLFSALQQCSRSYFPTVLKLNYEKKLFSLLLLQLGCYIMHSHVCMFWIIVHFCSFEKLEYSLFSTQLVSNDSIMYIQLLGCVPVSV